MGRLNSRSSGVTLAHPESEALTSRIIGLAIEVHRELGPGLLETTYEDCLCWELREAGVQFDRQPLLPVTYLKHTDLKVGLLFNFNSSVLIDGMKRVCL